jgi:protein-arginine kinase activator protein McsA
MRDDIWCNRLRLTFEAFFVIGLGGCFSCWRVEEFLVLAIGVGILPF